MKKRTANILVVDDDRLIRELVARWLSRDGYSFTRAANGEEALKLLENHRFDLAIIDIMMPGMSGVDLLAIMATRWPDTAVLMASAIDDRDMATQTLELSAYGYLIKPLSMNDTLISVANALERRRLVVLSKEYERALEERLRTIDELYGHIIQVDKAKAIADHTAEVAHQLRQPLAIIGGFARRIAKSAESGDNLDTIELRKSSLVMIREVERLEQILGGLIDFIRHEGVQLKPVNPNELIRNVLDLHDAWLEQRNLKLVTKWTEEVEQILLDPDRFQQVVRNLVANAIEASPLGGVIMVETGISIPTDKASETGGFSRESYFEMKIRNAGTRITEEDIGRIFDPFFTTKDYGTGMGLTLSRKIVEDHGGSLSIRSDDEFTQVTVWLPMSSRRESSCNNIPRSQEARL